MSISTPTDQMRERITDEIFFTLGLKRDGFLRRKFGHLFYRPTQRFVEMFARADEMAGRAGLAAAGRAFLSDLSIRVFARGTDHLPGDGPLLVISNHPGAYDSVALASRLPRHDLKIIAYESRFYHTLPAISQEMILAPADPSERMVTLRRVIQHLRQGGSILQFGSGKVEPDPAIASGTDDWLERWSPSVEVMLRKVPETRLVLAIVSGVLLRQFANHPLTRLRLSPVNQRKLAEYMQVIFHLTHPGSLNIDVRLNFSPPFTLAELEREAKGRHLMPAILDRARHLLSEHLAQHYPFARPWQTSS